MSQNKEVVKVDHVDFDYEGHLVLEDITLTVENGDFMGVVGPNGSGKTTLLKIILGLIHPLRGKVQVFGLLVEIGARGCLNAISPMAQIDLIQIEEQNPLFREALLYLQGEQGLPRLPPVRFSGVF